MDHPRRGTAIIFNHEYFYNPELSIRNGTNRDAQKLKAAFLSLGFEVTIHKDPIFSDIEYIIEKSILRLKVKFNSKDFYFQIST